jgi:hypothetical protein
MARIKKFSPKENLSSFQTLIVDTNSNSDYFRITEFKDTFTGGKNGFLIEGSQYLKESTEIKIEILDVTGNPIYFEPGNGIPEYYEGISKLIAVYVYEDTPIGLGKITILGELKQYDDNGVIRNVPDNWNGVYNVKWERTFQVNKLLSNEDKVRFYRRPQVEISEINKPIFTKTPVTVTQNGSVTGTPLIPNENTRLADFSLPTAYRLRVDSGNFWTGSIINQPLTFPGLTYNPIVTDIISKNEIIVSPPYTEGGIVKSFSNQNYSVDFTYLEGSIGLATALTGSFAKIAITDMKTFVGDAARIKVYRRSQSQLTDYEFVQDIQLESNELLRDIETVSTTEELYGNFTEPILSQYWVTSSNNLVTQFNQDFLYNSVQLDSVGTNYFYTSQSFSVQSGVEYNLSFNVRKTSNVNVGDYVKVFLSGSVNNSAVSQTITNVSSTNAILQKTNINENIIANNINNSKLYFEIVGNDWYINDVSFKAAQETAFSPDEITFIQSVPKILPSETFDYRFEFYDINNNYIPVLVEKTKTFDGGNLNLFEKSIDITADSLYFAFDSASAPSNPLPPFQIVFNVETTLVTGSVTFTSAAFDEFGDYISESQYVGGQYPGLLSGVQTDTPVLTVANFTGSRDDITVQYIRFEGEVEGVSDSIVITRVADGKGGVNFEIRPYRGTIIKNKSDKDLELQAIRIDGVNEIVLRDGLPQVGFSDAKLRVLSSSIDELTSIESSSYYLLSEAVDVGFLKGVTVGLTGSGELNYNATFNRDSIDSELTVYLMDGATQNDILTSIILTDLQDGLASGFITFDAEQFGIKPRIEREFTPSIGRVTGSFYLRGTNEEPISGMLDIYPSMSVDPLTIEPTYYMFYVTSSFDRRISINVTDFDNNPIGSGRPGIDVPFYSAISSKQLTTKFTYLEDITSASISVDKTFFLVPDGIPGDDAIVVNINPNPITLNADQRGRVFNYDGANTSLSVTQGRLPLIFTGSKVPGTFTTESITPIGIEYSELSLYGDTSMSLSGFDRMTDLTASIEYRLEIHPYFTGSFFTQSYFQQIQKSLDGAAAINVELEPLIISLTAEENGGIDDFSAANTTLRVKQGDEYLEFSTSSQVLPGTFSASFDSNNVLIGLLSSSNDNVTDRNLNDTLHFQNFNTFTQDSASVDYTIVVYPFSITNGIVSGSQTFTKKQLLSKQKAGINARSVSLNTTSNVVNFDGDGVVTSPLGSIILTANAFNITGSQAYYQFYRDDIPYSTVGTLNTFEIGSGDATNPGETATWSVRVRDGNPTSPEVARAEVTITGIKSGANNYQVSLTNPNVSVVVEVDGTTYLDNTGTQIRAYKGTQELTHVTNYSGETLDILGDPIGTLGEFSASLFSKPAYITQPNFPIGNPATILPITEWTNPQDNLTATIVYKVDIENGRSTYFLSQSLSSVFEGAVGPGIVFRGPYTGSIEYLFDIEQKRRDAVLFDKNGDGVPEMYYATLQTVPSSSIGLESVSVTPFGNIGGTSADYWEELGEQEFFVAAKIAIFEESFVENSINVGIPDPGDVNAKIAIVGGTQEPYIAIGQETQGYNQEGVFLGVSYDIASGSKYGKLSLKNTDGDRFLSWDGENLEIAGTIQVTGGNAATSEAVSGSFSTNSSTASLENPASYAFGPGASFPLEALPSTPTTPGLFLGSDYLGYHDGDDWNAYLDDGGNFYLGGTTGGALKFTQATGNLNVTGIVSASAGQFGGWVIDNKGISYRAPFAVGFQNNLSSTARFHGNLPTLIEAANTAGSGSYTGTPYVDGTPAQALFRGPDTTYGIPVIDTGITFPLDNLYLGANRLTVFGTTTTTHAILESSSLDLGNDYGIVVDPGLYAESASIRIDFFQTASILLSSDSGNIDWGNGTDVVTFSPVLGGFIPVNGDKIESFVSLGSSNGLLNYIHAYDVPVLGVGNVQDIYLRITGYNPSTGEMQVDLQNDYGNTVRISDADRLTIYVTMGADVGDSLKIFQGSTSAGTRTLVSSTGEAVRLHTSGSTINNINNNRPFFSLGQITQSFDQTGVFIGFPSGSQTPRFSIRSIEGQFIRWNGDAIQLSGDIVGSTIAGSSIIGGAINVPTTGTGSRFSVDVDGNVSASNANISGIINADSGRIGQWIIDAETGNLQDIDAKIVFDPLIPELQFYTGSGGGRVKKVSISPQDTLSPSNAGTQTLNVTSSVTINTTGTVSSVESSAENQFTNFGTYYRTGLTSTGGVGSNGVFSVPQAGFVDVTLTVPNFGVTAPAGIVAHTTSYPNYSPPYTGFFHGGNSQPRTAIAQLYLEAVQVSTGTVVGSLLLGQATAFGAYTLGNYYQGVTDEGPGGPGGEEFFSVTGDTLITLSNGDVILAKDLIEGEHVLAWGWNSNLDNCIIDEFSEYKVSSVKSRIVDKIYKISAGGKTIKVSDSHGFWLNDNNQIKAAELVEGISEINIKDGNTIKVVKVDSVQIIHELTTVYTIEVPGVHNYISNDIISHNSGFWEYYPSVTQNSVAFNYTAGGTKTVSINISVADDIQLRYALRYGAQSGFTFNKDSTINFQNGTSEYFTHTVSSFSTAPTPLDSSLEIKSPTNFVEVKAGGIQVVSGDNVYVSIPRKPEGSSDPTMLHIEGGTLFTNTILPSTDVSPSSTFDIGSAFSKYANLNGLNISGLAVSLQSSVTTDTSPGVTTVSNTDSYAVLPGGTIIQWGSIDDSTNPKTVVFPVTFPTSVSSVVCSTVRNSGGSDGTNHVYNIRRSQCDLVLDGRYGFWIAMGH